MNKEFKELNKKETIEVCALIVRFNSQLLEARFKMATGEMSKTHLIQRIRHNLARCLYIMKTRGYKVSVGSHGIYLIDEKTNKITDYTKKVNEFMASEQAKADQAKKTKVAKKAEENKKVEKTEKVAESKKLDKPEPAKKPAKPTKKSSAKQPNKKEAK